MSLFPIHIVENEEQFKQITDDYCYMLGSNGFFVKKKNVAFNALQPYFSKDKDAKEVHGLYKIEAVTTILLPNMTSKFVKTFLDFFRYCYNEHKAEGFLYLYFNPDTKKYDVKPAEQEVSGAHIEYGEMPDPEPGFKPVGTMHSHGNMGAFHSSTDHNDQTEFDGIHITVGKIDTAAPEFDIKLYVTGQSFKVKPEHILPKMHVPKLDFPEEWKTSVKKKTYPAKVYTYPASSKVCSTGAGKTSVSEDSIKATARAFVENIAKASGVGFSSYDSETKVTLRYDIQTANVGIEAWGVIGNGSPKVYIGVGQFNNMSKESRISWVVDKIKILTGNTNSNNKGNGKSKGKNNHMTTYNPETVINHYLNMEE